MKITLWKMNAPIFNCIAFIFGCYLLGNYFHSQKLGFGLFLIGMGYLGKEN